MAKSNGEPTHSIRKILVKLVISATLANAIICSLSYTPLCLSENQFLYLFSTMAQVIGGMFGLTLTAYAFFVDKFKGMTLLDQSYYDATESLLQKNYDFFKIIAILSGACLFLCILGVILLNNKISFYLFIVKEAVLFFTLGILSILVFGITLLEPERLKNETIRLKEKIEEEYNVKSDAKRDDVNIENAGFQDFMATYNKFENLIIQFARELQENNGRYYEKYRPQIIQSIQVLNQNEIINHNIADEINELRQYRNGLAHGADFTVSPIIYKRLNLIYQAIDTVHQLYTTSKIGTPEWNESVKAIYNL